MKFWSEKRIILIVSGGIAAYRSLDIIRIFRQQGAKVTVVATASALEFVSRISLQALSGEPVQCALMDPSQADGMDHIHLTRSADLIVIAPATANLMAKMATGFADGLVAALLLARGSCPLLVAPAMNSAMWENPATRRNVAQLIADGVHFVGPATGSLACGEEGEGRLAPVEHIIEAAHNVLTAKTLVGRRLLITAGPTHEYLDPVRFIANHSSGKMGWSICRAAIRAGAEVVLVHGPTALEPPIGAESRPVTTAQEMFAAAVAVWQGEAGKPACDGAILTAAVGDFRPLEIANDKIKKTDDNQTLNLELIRNPDILATLAAEANSGQNKQVVVGFAAETGNALERGREKMLRKGCDLLVINDLLEEGAGFGGDSNRVTILDRNGNSEPWPLLSKDAVGAKLIAEFARLMGDSEDIQDNG